MARRVGPPREAPGSVGRQADRRKGVWLGALVVGRSGQGKGGGKESGGLLAVGVVPACLGLALGD